MTIWADGDSLQAEIRALLESRSLREAGRPQGPRFELVYVASRKLRVPAGIRQVLVEQGPDAADRRIEDDSLPGDLAVTRDLPLAERLAVKGLVVLNDRGETLTADLARERRSVRDQALRLRSLGLAPESPKGRSWGQRELKAFADAFDRALQRRLNELARAEAQGAADGAGTAAGTPF